MLTACVLAMDTKRISKVCSQFFLVVHLCDPCVDNTTFHVYIGADVEIKISLAEVKKTPPFKLAPKTTVAEKSAWGALVWTGKLASNAPPGRISLSGFDSCLIMFHSFFTQKISLSSGRSLRQIGRTIK